MKHSLILVISFLIFLPRIVHGYSAETHANLTDETIKLYSGNQHQIVKDYKPYLIDGSRREDDPPRWLNHFYDPIYDRGLAEGKYSGNRSMDWAMNGSLQNQAMYQVPATIASVLTSIQEGRLDKLSVETNFTWSEAIRYYANEDYEEAMFALGHVLHLLQDLAVPDHTRNDPHPEKSPYESWVKEKKPAIFKIIPIQAASLENTFSEIAIYSNKNFYSFNTLGLGHGYTTPVPDEFENVGDYRHAVGRDEKGVYVLYRERLGSSGVLVKTRSQIILDDQVFQSYWDRLSVKAVGHGIGLIDLFFQEAEKAKADTNFSKKQNKTFIASVVDALRNGIGKTRGFLLATINIFSDQKNLKISIGEPGISKPPLEEKQLEEQKETQTQEIITEESEPPIIQELEEEIEVAEIIEQEEVLSRPAPPRINPKIAYTPPRIPNSSSRIEVPILVIATSTPPSTPSNINPTSTPTSSVVIGVGHILISEIFFNAEGKDDEKEFIELYNPTNHSIDISDWKLKIKRNEKISSLADFDQEKKNFIMESKSFFLVGFSGNALGDVKRSASLPNDTASIILLRSDEEEVDKVFYSSVVPEGNSLERKALGIDGCLDPFEANEFMGNGCDFAGDETDFVIRNIPTPQGMINLYEPREKPATPVVLKTDYSWEDLTINIELATSSADITFQIGGDISATLLNSSSSYSMAISEVGKDYEFYISAVDLEGYSSDKIEKTVNVPSFIKDFYFTKDPADSGKYILDIFYDRYPFINPKVGNFWQGIVLYLNSEPNSANSWLTTPQYHAPEDKTNVLMVNTSQRYSTIFGLSPEYSSGIGGGLNNSTFLLPAEDGHLRLTLASSSLDLQLSNDDYITLAFYDFSYAGGGSQNLTLSAIDKTSRHFKDSVERESPSSPVVEYVLDNLSMTMHLNWEQPEDSDSPDYEISYEYRHATSSEFGLWQQTNERRAATPLVFGNSYIFNVRAKDKDGNTSEPWSLEWSFPDGFIPYHLSGNLGYATQEFTLATTSTLSSVDLYTANLQTNARLRDDAKCYVGLYKKIESDWNLLVDSPTSRGGWECEGTPNFDLTGIEVGAGIYKLAISVSTGNASSWSNIQFYGNNTNSAGGFFSDPSLINMKFKLNSPTETLFKN